MTGMVTVRTVNKIEIFRSIYRNARKKYLS